LGTQIAKEMRARKIKTKDGMYVFESSGDFMGMFDVESDIDV